MRGARSFPVPRKMGAPLVSVVIPAYNCADVIGKTLDSVARQTYGNIETVVVDDGSSDDTGNVVAGFSGNGKVRYYRQENGGPGSARNTGIRSANGDYIAFLDADDSLTPDSIERRMALIREANGLELVYSNYFIKRSDDSAKARFGENYPGNRDFFRREFPHGVVFEGSPTEIFDIPFDFWTATVLAGRNLLDRTGPFRTDISIGEDRDMWIRLSLNAGKIGYIKSPVATYNRTRNSLTGRNAVRYSLARKELNHRFLEQYGASLGRRKVRKVIHEKLSWVYYDLGSHYRRNGMTGHAIANFLKSIYFSPTNDLPYKEIVSSVLPGALRHRLKRSSSMKD
jgi:glycosyltransferase involved in cell wall biosynthesis